MVLLVILPLLVKKKRRGFRAKKKCLLVLLIIAMITNMSTIAYASEANCSDVEHGFASDHLNNCYTEYCYIGESIQEIAYIQINETMLVSNRLIAPDGTFVMNVSDGTDTNIVRGYVDFEVFEAITEEHISKSNSIMPLGNDVTGSQYKHVYIGSPGSTTIDSTQLSKVTNALSAYSLLASVTPLPGAVLTGAASLLLSVINSNSPAKVVISSDTYEVVTSYDNTYLFHCYHQVIKSYDSGGHYLGSEKEYIQVIGG